MPSIKNNAKQINDIVVGFNSSNLDVEFLITRDDSLFYFQPRFVHHLDEGFRVNLSNLYREKTNVDQIYYGGQY